MKKLSKKLAVLLTAVLFAGMLAGCSGGKDTDPTPTPTTAVEQPSNPTATKAVEPTAAPTEAPTPEPTATPVVVEKRNIDVWDFGGAQETDALYKNNITAADWDAYADLAEGGTFSNDGTVTFGDLTLSYKAKDRLFSGTSVKNYGDNSLAQTAHEDGYTADGMYYCNGTGGDNRRYMTIANVKAGDLITLNGPATKLLNERCAAIPWMTAPALAYCWRRLNACSAWDTCAISTLWQPLRRR